MKKIFLFMIMLFSVSTMFSQETPLTRKERKAAQKAEQIYKTRTSVESGEWQFNANHMLPSSGGSRSLTSSYRVIIKDQDLDCYLPYFGRAYRAEYGSTDSPMNFHGKISDLKVEIWDKGGWIITFKTSNKNDSLDFIFYISETGSANLNVNSIDRQSISYRGDLEELESRK